MQSCSIRGCNSYKEIGAKNVGYYKFPLHDQRLLRQWLEQIGRPGWKPTGTSQICGSHFLQQDFGRYLSSRNLFLKPTAVPSIFPYPRKKISLKSLETDPQSPQNQIGLEPRKVQQPQIIQLPMDNLSTANQQNRKLSMFIPKPMILLPSQLDQLKNSPQMSPIPIQPRLRKILPKPDNLNVTKPADLVLPKPGNLNLVKLIPFPPPGISTKRPILRITIDKKYKVPSAEKSKPLGSPSPDCSENKEDLKIGKIKDEIIGVVDENTTLERRSSPKPACYKLLGSSHRSSRATPRVIKSEAKLSTPPTTSNADVKEEHVYENKSSSVYLSKLQYMNSKAREDCDQLRKRLKVLKQRERQGQGKITKLKGRLSKMGVKVAKIEVTKTYKEYLRSKMRKKFVPATTTSNECQDEYEVLHQDASKVKQTMPLQETMLNSRDEETHKNEENKALKESEERKESKAEEGRPHEAFGGINDDSGEIIGEIDEESIDMDLGTDAKSFDLKEPYLDAGLIVE